MWACFWLLTVTTFFFAMSLVNRVHNNQLSVPVEMISIIMDSESFIAYRNAVVSYVGMNPSFRGSVPAKELGIQLPPSFSKAVGNFISSSNPGNNVVVTCYGKLASGSLGSILEKTENDASFGIVVGGHAWQSGANGADISRDLIPLTIQLQAGDIVSVVQLGVNK